MTTNSAKSVSEYESFTDSWDEILRGLAFVPCEGENERRTAGRMDTLLLDDKGRCMGNGGLSQIPCVALIVWPPRGHPAVALSSCPPNFKNV